MTAEQYRLYEEAVAAARPRLREGTRARRDVAWRRSERERRPFLYVERRRTHGDVTLDLLPMGGGRRFSPFQEKLLADLIRGAGMAASWSYTSVYAGPAPLGEVRRLARRVRDEVFALETDEAF